jgi:hypothetical protein
MNRVKLFIHFAGGLLLAAALTRFLLGLGHEPFLSLPDPLLGIPLRYALLLVGCLELVVALICLFGRRICVQIGWLAWLITGYVVCRIGLLTMNCHPQATSLGSLNDPLQLSRGLAGAVTGLLILCLLTGSYGGVIWLWLEMQRAKAATYPKTSCPSCGAHIRFDLRNAGQNTNCPRCHAAVTLRKPDEQLKMSCFFCHEHIEFPAHALGQKLKCPHCNNDITLKDATII